MTEEGESNGLYVTGKGSKDFTVKEKRGGTSAIAFSYRVAGKRPRAAGRAADAGDAAPRLDVERFRPGAPPARPNVNGSPPARPKVDGVTSIPSEARLSMPEDAR